MEEGSFSEMPPGPAFLCEFSPLGAAFLPSLQADGGMALGPPCQSASKSILCIPALCLAAR